MATPRSLTRLSVAAAATLVPGLFLAGPSLATETPAAQCHPSYPSICIPLGSPDVDCPELRAQGMHDFVVIEPDPHRLDDDNDGIGCETMEGEPTQPPTSQPTSQPTRHSTPDAKPDTRPATRPDTGPDVKRAAKKSKPRVPKEIRAGL